jgi:hypothetical protein
MAPRSVISSEQAPSSPLFSQAIVCNGMMYLSGNIGMDTKTQKLVEGSVGDRTVGEIGQQLPVPSLLGDGSSIHSDECNLIHLDSDKPSRT